MGYGCIAPIRYIGNTGQLVVEGDVWVFPLVDNSAQVLSKSIDMSTIIADI